jgi:hypothetical protein
VPVCIVTPLCDLSQICVAYIYSTILYICLLSRLALSMESGYESVCACGRSFLQPGALTKHKRTCRSSKKRLSSALEQAKRFWKGSKRRRLETDTPDPNPPPLAAGLVLESELVVPTVLMEVRLFFVMQGCLP